LYRSDERNSAHFDDQNRAASETIINAFLEMGIDSVVGARRAWVNVTRDVLLGDLMQALPRKRVVIELLENVGCDGAVIDRVRQLREAGYLIALDDFVYRPEAEPLVELAHAVKLDVLPCQNADEIEALVAPLRDRSVKLLAEKVETAEELDVCRKLGFELFQGFYLQRPNIVSQRRVPASRLGILRVLSKLQDPGADFRELENCIRTDVGLSYKLLRYINSAWFGLSVKVNSIRQALVLVGLTRVRTWVSMLALSGVEDKPRELMINAITRAKMCESIAERKGRARTDAYFAVGLFSLLDALMDQPMKELLDQLPLAADVNGALLERRGPLGAVLDAVVAYEHGRWDDVPNIDLDAAVLRELYLEALGFAETTVSDLDPPSARASARRRRPSAP